MEAEVAERVVLGLRSVTDAMIRDRTWKDLARPIDKACAFIEMNDAHRARKCLEEALSGWPRSTSENAPLFPEHERFLQDVLSAIPEVSKVVNPRVSESLMRVEDGFSLEQCVGKAECAVVVPVPRNTKKRDVLVKFSEDRLGVFLNGVAVIDGFLSQPVNTDGCFWFLEENSVLSVNLEKKAPEFVWAGLLKEDLRGR